MATRKTIVKRQYSRAGCIECKRRKIKCDEQKPVCGYCARQETECVFPDPNHRNKPRVRRQVPSPPDPVAPSELPPLDAPLLDNTLYKHLFDDASQLVNGMADYDLSLSMGVMGMKPFDEELNNGIFSHEIVWDQFDPTPQYVNLELIDKIVETYDLTPEETDYFKAVTIRDLFFYIYPFASSIEDNEVMHVFLEYLVVFKYMVYALMSLGASCLFTITGDRKHDSNQKLYTGACMKLLVTAFHDIGNNEHSLWHIEGLILTVLILTMLFSDMSFVDTASVPVLWIGHLREAHNLLLKYNAIKMRVLPSVADSNGITIAKMLFFSYDWISKLHGPLSHVVQGHYNDTSLLSGDSQYISTLKKLGVVIPSTDTHSGFNLYLTLTREVIATVHKMLDVLTECNKGDKPRQALPYRVSELLAMIHVASEQKIVPDCTPSNKFLIAKDSPAHPDFPHPGRLALPFAAYGKDDDNMSSEPVYYSWCDLAQLMHVNFLYLKVLTSPELLQLPRDHPMIEAIVSTTIDVLFFIKPKTVAYFRPDLAMVESERFYISKSTFSYRAIMLQLPLWLCINLAEEDEHFEKLELYFRALVKLGSGNCSLGVARAIKNRELAKERKKKLRNGSNDDYIATGFPIY